MNKFFKYNKIDIYYKIDRLLGDNGRYVYAKIDSEDRCLKLKAIDILKAMKGPPMGNYDSTPWMNFLR